MAEEAATVAPSPLARGRPRPSLRSRLRRAERARAIRALLLVAPLFLFLAVTFVVPIGAMLLKAVDDKEISTALPETASALRQWDGDGPPPRPVVSALVRELPIAARERSLAAAAQRLNHDISGFRSLMLNTARELPAMAVDDPAVALVAIDERWRDPDHWQAMRRAAGPTTDLYVLAALDLDRDATGTIVTVPADEAIFVPVLLRTLWISAIVTGLCLVLGYPLAYLLATRSPRRANLLLILVLLPFWTSLMVRTSAWIVLLQNEGVINGLLLRLAVIETPLPMMFNRFGVVVAMSHVLLPFMVLPLYSVMKGIRPETMRAASALGAPPFVAFLRVYLPQSAPGIAAGTLLVFILALGYYVTPALVGGADDQMVSYFIAFYTQRTVNWGLASALAGLLLVATGLLYAAFGRLAAAGGLRFR